MDHAIGVDGPALGIDLGAVLCATLVLAAGTAVITVRGSR